MPDLPERADIDQLRRKARELLRAAVAGEPDAVARLRAVSERPTLAAAQLAIAREHGLPSWPALRSELGSRRPSTEWQPRADAGRAEAQDIIALGRWSFGGAGTIKAEEGELTLGILIAGPEGGCRWLDVRGRDASVTRLLRSGLVPVRVSGLGPVAGSPAEQELRDMAQRPSQRLARRARRRRPR